jgi:hypothetical protein
MVWSTQFLKVGLKRYQENLKYYYPEMMLMVGYDETTGV